MMNSESSEFRKKSVSNLCSVFFSNILWESGISVLDKVSWSNIINYIFFLLLPEYGSYKEYWNYYFDTVRDREKKREKGDREKERKGP